MRRFCREFARPSRRRGVPDIRGRNSDIVTATRELRDRRHVDLGPRLARLAVFDLDRTLIPGASIVALVRELAARKLLSRRRVVRAGLEHVVYRRRGSTDAQVEPGTRSGTVDRRRHGTSAAALGGGRRRRPVGGHCRPRGQVPARPPSRRRRLLRAVVVEPPRGWWSGSAGFSGCIDRWAPGRRQSRSDAPPRRPPGGLAHPRSRLRPSDAIRRRTGRGCPASGSAGRGRRARPASPRPVRWGPA